MILRFLFGWLPLKKQVSLIKRRGINLGTRLKDGRRVYVYMLRNLFVEVQYVRDNEKNMPQSVFLISGIDNLRKHLEDEFRRLF
jgi:hypothetical protein